MASSSSLVFSVSRREPELITPADPTPHDLRYLSDIDDQDGLRFQIPLIQIYKRKCGMEGKDPVRVLRDAIARTLVYYYPFAGRLREGPNRKLVVDCTGEGVMFIEADASVRLDQFGEALHPPFPCLEELIYDVPGSAGIVNCPLLLIQVTRLMCGGFILVFRFNHTMCDGTGMVQFMNAVGEMARGFSVPSVQPVWDRELLSARSPPLVSCVLHEYNHVPSTLAPFSDMVNSSLFIGPQEVSALKRHVPPHLRTCTRFEILTACLWKCRTAALIPDPNVEVRMICIVNARSKFNPPLPNGYYGNVLALSAAVSTAGKLCDSPLEYALKLVQRAKSNVTLEYMKSVADLMVIKGRPHYTVVGAYLVSDITRIGFGDVDFGWGKAVYGGPAEGGVEETPGVLSYYMPMKSSNKIKGGGDGIVVPVCLPRPAMKKFAMQFGRMMNKVVRVPRL